MSDRDERGTSERPSEPSAPLLRVITPGTTPEEVAAIVAVFASLGGDAEGDVSRRPVRAWASPARGVRRSLPRGRGAWRASALPH